MNCNHQISTDLHVISANSEPEVEACLEELDTNAVLVRPDRYVLGTAKTEKELNELLAFKLPSPMSAKWSDKTCITTSPSLKNPQAGVKLSNHLAGTL